MQNEHNELELGDTVEESVRKGLLEKLVGYLMEERQKTGGWMPQQPASINSSAEELWLTFRALVNTREPLPASPEFLELQDALLQGMIADEGITRIGDTEASPLDPRLHLWRGDITTLAADSIVNAANSGMTGCWAPLHYCIDNAIHTFAGVQLRQECARIMAKQGHPEPTAHAKVTPAYNLPAKHVIHTVGPIANGNPSTQHREQLVECYQACLNAALQAKDTSIAFCCISTGVFGFPQEEAALIAVNAVRRWLAEHPASAMVVVFNVFLPEDERIYRSLLDIG